MGHIISKVHMRNHKTNKEIVKLNSCGESVEHVT